MTRLQELMLPLLVIVAGAAPTQALAESILNVKALAVGIQESQLYATLDSLPSGCRNATVYHSAENQAGQYVMSVLLSARSSGKPISRIDYTIRADGSCWIILAEF